MVTGSGAMSQVRALWRGFGTLHAKLDSDGYRPLRAPGHTSTADEGRRPSVPVANGTGACKMTEQGRVPGDIYCAYHRVRDLSLVPLSLRGRATRGVSCQRPSMSYCSVSARTASMRA
jgi:hypothetical protein